MSSNGNEPSFYLTRPFEQDPRHLQPVRDAIAAGTEEMDLEAVVSVVGSERAQEAAERHHLPDLVRSLNDG